MHVKIQFALAFLLPPLLLGWEAKFAVPVIPSEEQRLTERIKQSLIDSNTTALQRSGREWLELYPNDPVLQATAYMVLGEAARRSGDPAAAEFDELAARLDPSLADRLANSQEPSTRTRGDKMGRLDTAMSAFAAGAQAYQQIRMANQQQKMQRMQQQQMQTQQMPPQQPVQQMYPQQPVQQPYPQQPVQQPFPQQPVQQMYPQQGAAVVYPPVPVNDPSYQPNPAQPALMPGWQPQQPQPSGGPMSPQPPAAFPATPQPYRAPAYSPGMQVTRGAKPQSWKVVHDHTQGGVQAYFAERCGALLSVDKNQLIFTGAGGEAPLSIPARGHPRDPHELRHRKGSGGVPHRHATRHLPALGARIRGSGRVTRRRRRVAPSARPLSTRLLPPEEAGSEIS